MDRAIRGLFWLATIWCFGHVFFLWGGLAHTPVVGRQLREQASVQSPIAATYLFLGRHLVSAASVEARAVDYASKRLGKQIADQQSPRQTLVQRFVSAQSAAGRLAYYGAPLFLVLSLVLHARRQKRIRSFGVRD